MRWLEKWLLQEIKEYDLCDIGNADEMGVFFSLQLADETSVFFRLQLVKFLIFAETYHGGTKPKQQVSFLLEWKVDGSNKLPPLLTGNYRSLHC
jgi:hypothetical protein